MDQDVRDLTVDSLEVAGRDGKGKDEFRYYWSKMDADGASTGKSPENYFGLMLGESESLGRNAAEGKTRGLGLVPADKSEAELAFKSARAGELSADLGKLEDKQVELGRERKGLEEKSTVLSPDTEKNKPAKFASRGNIPAVVLKVDPQKPQTPAPVQENRKIIRTADVGVEVDSYDAASTKITELVTAEKGFVASANTQKMANGKIQATVVVRVPPDRFDAVVAKLKELGTVRYQNIGSEDVTKAYVDLESRLKGKEILAERLRKLLAEGKGSVKELMEVEVQLGNTNEAIERIKGEIKFYDNRIGLSTLTLQIAEKDLGQPFEYVQTLQANLALTARDPDDAYAKAQKEILGAGGQVVDSRMSRQNDGSSIGTIRARVEADKFAALRDALRKLGFPTNDTVNLQKSAHGGQEGTPKVDAPLRKELASLDLTISSPPLFVTHKSQLLVESPAVESAYQNSRKAIEAAGGKIVDGALAGRGDRMQGSLRAQVDADKFAALVESLKTAGTLKNANVNHLLPTVTPEGMPLLRERAEIEFTVVSPPQLIGDEHGLVKTIRDTFANSWSGLLWSIEKLFVGVSLAGPWVLLLAAGLLGWRRLRRKKALSIKN
jgi:glycine cleavage system regulatory protein